MNKKSLSKRRVLVLLKRKAFQLWSLNVRKNGVCEHCGVQNKSIKPNGKPVILHAHHIISRQNKALAWDVKNGICLCAFCHKFSQIGPHQGGIIFAEWFRNKYPDIHEYLLKNYQNEVEITPEHMEVIVEELKEKL